MALSDFRELPTLERIARGTGRIRGATGFYLGTFGGSHVVATNHHVCPSATSCRGQRFSLPLEGLSFTVDTFLGTWSSIDLALMTIQAPDKDLATLARIANPFVFDLPLRPGQKLLTVGFGSAANPNRQLVAVADADCKVFSAENEFRLMADPDTFNPSGYLAWSFANGCDVSHGDSGSAMVDRESGAVVGIIWTGKVPKKAQVRDPNYLNGLLESGSTEIWTELSYAVPAVKMLEVLKDELESGRLPISTRAILEDLLGS